ncbi:hypothetical protein [Methylobacterium platani]|uniref:hypothetical protein n=1 Tax=Methylobacterium platani TaxID=427683 RepID=UPI0012E16F7D|nr:hypothetical protein [Methylobacterium platani]
MATAQKETISAGFDAESDVVHYVASIIVPGAPIYCEFTRMRDTRLTVVRSSTGMAILQHQPHGQIGPCYSIVTAYSGKNPHGTRIGKVEVP